MATRPNDVPVKLSVLDRLLDDERGKLQDVPQTRSKSLAQLKEAVRRDLEWLLNTRRVAMPVPEDLQEAYRSVYMFGLPDLTTLSLANPKHQVRLVRAIQHALKTFEPRITNVRLIDLGIPEKGSRVLRLRVEGTLRTDAANELVSFDTVLELASGTYEVEHAR